MDSAKEGIRIDFNEIHTISESEYYSHQWWMKPNRVPFNFFFYEPFHCVIKCINNWMNSWRRFRRSSLIIVCRTKMFVEASCVLACVSMQMSVYLKYPFQKWGELDRKNAREQIFIGAIKILFFVFFFAKIQFKHVNGVLWIQTISTE